jgi:hypothetical protein
LLAQVISTWWVWSVAQSVLGIFDQGVPYMTRKFSAVLLEISRVGEGCHTGYSCLKVW